MAISLLFSLNKYIAVPILSEWLLFKDIACLFTAISHSNCKLLKDWILEFSELFSLNLLTENCKNDLSYDLYLWCLKYGLDFSKLECALPENVLMWLLGLGEENVEHYFSSLRNVVLYGSYWESKEHVTTTIKNVQRLRLCETFASVLAEQYPLKNLLHCSLESGKKTNFIDHHIGDLCRNCPQLTSLNLSSHKPQFLSAEASLKIVIYLRKLKHLTLFHVDLVRRWRIYLLHCKAPLSTLTNWNSYGLIYIGKQLNKLELVNSMYEREVELGHWCPHLTDLTISNINNNFNYNTMIANLGNLIHLRIMNGSLSSLNLMNTLKYCSKLMTLELIIKAKDKIDYEKVFSILPTDLTSLHLPGWNLLDNDLLVIANRCFHLTDLNIKINLKLSDKSMIVVAKQCRKLKTLDITHTSITDATLIALATHCKRIEVLNVSHCYEITEEGFLHVVKYLPIKSITALGCSVGLSDNSTK